MEIDEVLMAEEKLSFQEFKHKDAYCLGQAFVKEAEEKNLRPLGIRIVAHGVVVYQYLMDGKNDDIWLRRKQNTVDVSKHSGYYVFLENEKNGAYQELEHNDEYVICGGGFPLRENNEIIGSVCVSGLAHHEDHQLIVDVLGRYLAEK